MATVKNATPSAKAADKSVIRELITNFYNALEAKDVPGMMACYASDVVFFDVKPPMQTKGAVALRHVWEACLPFFPAAFKVEIKDLHIVMNDDLAFAHYLFRITTGKDHPAAQGWLRATAGYRRQQGRWKIVHEHGSAPFNPHTMQAVMDGE